MFELVILFLNDIIYISLYFYFFILFLWFLYIYSKNSEVYKFEVFIYFKIYFFLLIVGLIYLVYINPINIWYSFDFIIYFDYLSRFIILFFLIAFSCFLFIFIKLKMEFFYYFEYLFILMLSIFIVNFLFKVFDLMLLFILLEAFSLCLYILVSSNYTTIKISEIGIKYYVIAVISSLFFLYGIILLYFNFGTFNIMKIKILMLLTPKFNESLILILLFLLGSLFFKLGVAPFHLWVVEVYVNVNLVTFFYLSVFSKFVFFIIFFKLILYFLMYYYSYYYYLFLIMGLLSIIIGSIGALIYVDIKKILAYGSIVHSGFLILSFINISYYSFYAFLFYLLVYVILMLNFFLFFFFFLIFIFFFFIFFYFFYLFLFF